MEQYEGVLDLAILEELEPSEARDYLEGKYGLEFAEKTIRLLEYKALKFEELNS